MRRTNKYRGFNDMPKGWTTQSYENRKIYKLWFNMLRRCYDVSQFARPQGKHYRECEVSETWKKLSAFQQDIKTLPNYDSWLNTDDYVLDKDIITPNNKKYCLSQCSFVTKEQSMQDMNARHPEIHGLHKTKYRLYNKIESYVFDTEKAACEFLGVQKCTVAASYRQKCKCKGYSVERIEQR